MQLPTLHTRVVAARAGLFWAHPDHRPSELRVSGHGPRPDSSLLPLSVGRSCSLIQRRAQSSGELNRIVIGPEMKEDQPRLLVQHVAVDRGDLDAVRSQGANDRVDL